MVFNIIHPESGKRKEYFDYIFCVNVYLQHDGNIGYYNNQKAKMK